MTHYTTEINDEKFIIVTVHDIPGIAIRAMIKGFMIGYEYANNGEKAIENQEAKVREALITAALKLGFGENEIQIIKESELRTNKLLCNYFSQNKKEIAEKSNKLNQLKEKYEKIY